MHFEKDRYHLVNMNENKKKVQIDVGDGTRCNKKIEKIGRTATH